MSEPTSQQLCENLMRVVGQVAGRRLLLCLEAAAEDTRKEREEAVLAERERCAKIAEGWRAAFKYEQALGSNQFEVRNATCNNIARAIREDKSR